MLQLVWNLISFSMGLTAGFLVIVRYSIAKLFLINDDELQSVKYYRGDTVKKIQGNFTC